MKVLTLILAGVALVSCATKNFQWTLADFSPTHTVVIDASYEIYAREVFKTQTDTVGKFTITANERTRSKQDLIEIQQLLISKTSPVVVYFTTIPDERQEHYAKEELSSGLLNIDDLYRIHVGRKEGNVVQFYEKDDRYFNEWELLVFTDSIRIKRIGQWKQQTLIQEINVEQALEAPVRFTKKNFAGIAWAPRNRDPKIWRAENKLYFVEKGKKNYQVWFVLAEKVIGNQDQEFKHLYFKPKRLRNSLNKAIP